MNSYIASNTRVSVPTAREIVLNTWLANISDDSYIHLTDLTDTEFRAGLHKGSSFVSKGNVGRLTVPQFKSDVVMKLAAGHGFGANRFAVVSPSNVNHAHFEHATERNIAEVQEFLSTRRIHPDKVITVPRMRAANSSLEITVDDAMRSAPKFQPRIRVTSAKGIGAWSNVGGFVAGLGADYLIQREQHQFYIEHSWLPREMASRQERARNATAHWNMYVEHRAKTEREMPSRLRNSYFYAKRTIDELQAWGIANPMPNDFRSREYQEWKQESRQRGYRIEALIKERDRAEEKLRELGFETPE